MTRSFFYGDFYMYIPKLRRINDAVAEIKAADSQTVITRNQIIMLIKDGFIKPMKFGNAWLINMDELYALFNGELK